MAASEQSSSLDLVLADRQLSGNRYGRFGHIVPFHGIGKQSFKPFPGYPAAK